MNAALGPARPQDGRGAAQPHTATSTRGDPFPQRIDYRRAATRIKDASGAAMRPGRARSLTRAVLPARTRHLRGKGEPRGLVPHALQKGHLTRNRRPKPHLTPARSFRDEWTRPKVAYLDKASGDPNGAGNRRRHSHRRCDHLDHESSRLDKPAFTRRRSQHRPRRPYRRSANPSRSRHRRTQRLSPRWRPALHRLPPTGGGEVPIGANFLRPVQERVDRHL